MDFRFMTRSFLDDAVKPLMQEAHDIDPHIFNLYEELDAPVTMLYDIIDAALTGGITEVQEKMDGQNVTFTVINDELQFFSKGASWRRLEKAVTGQNPGRNRQKIVSDYDHIPHVREAFLDAYDVLDRVAKNNKSLSDKLFQNGSVVIETALLHPKTPNTIIYDNPSIRFIQAAALNPESILDSAAYDEFVGLSKRAEDKIKLDTVPIIEFLGNTESKEQIKELREELSSLLDSANVTKNDTVGELIESLVRWDVIDKNIVSDDLVDAAVKRLVRKDKKALSNKMFLNKDDWKRFQAVEKSNTLVSHAIIPLEKIIQKLGAYAFRNFEFALGSNDTDSGKQLQNFVHRVRAAFDKGNILADDVTLERISAALDRIGDNADLFEKNVEGIVFMWNDKFYKLTGMFTPINKLRGFFNYGKQPATLKGDN